jgi:endonuclease/exonuclease/phosphatase family metal-dependent hydrolase
LHIVTWNIHAARTASIDAIAAELRALKADVAALQEVDYRASRTGFVDEPAMLAARLGFQYVFAASIKIDEGDYGLAVLSRWPLVDVRRYRVGATGSGEPRILLEATICARGHPLHVFNHHADLRAASRDSGLVDVRSIVKADIGRGMLVVGDFNETANRRGVTALIDAGLVDTGAAVTRDTTNEGRIDYILADPPLAHRASHPPGWTTTKSDHNAMIVDLKW